MAAQHLLRADLICTVLNHYVRLDNHNIADMDALEMRLQFILNDNFNFHTKVIALRDDALRQSGTLLGIVSYEARTKEEERGAVSFIWNNHMFETKVIKSGEID